MSTSRRTPKRARQLGVSDDEYARLLAAQDGHCALCPATPQARRLHVDHDHRTGKVRGLLCHRCNRALPAWITPRWLDEAWMYLNRTTESMAQARRVAPRRISLGSKDPKDAPRSKDGVPTPYWIQTGPVTYVVNPDHPDAPQQQ